jgi:DNA-binding CsgD family transcriptional regulator
MRLNLSGRERTVAALIGEGMTTGEIAASLKISERTVDSHAEHIRKKLDLHSRAQIAAWAVRELLLEHSR